MSNPAVKPETEATESTHTGKRANGIAARNKILDAAALIATERGYEGTSISLVSKRSGLPASSIYWHFKNKDDLIGAVIERSFGEWLAAIAQQKPPARKSVRAFVEFQAYQATRSLQDAPDFLRLGLMLALEHRPEDPTARQTFLRVRTQAFRNVVNNLSEALPNLDQHSLETVASFVVSLADGFFISSQVADTTQNLLQRQDLFAAAVLGVINEVKKKAARNQ